MKYITHILLLSLLLLSCSDSGENRSSDAGSGSVRDEVGGKEEPGQDSPSPTATNVEEYQKAADLVRQHYTAISRGSYRRAFDLWETGSRDFEEFSREAEGIRRAVVAFGSSGRAGTAEGMPTIEVPVTVQITTPEGTTEERHETFLLRKSPDQGWRLLQRRDS